MYYGEEEIFRKNNIETTDTTHSYICNDCGYTETKPHTFRYTSKNATQHTKICTDCGTSITENHNYEGKILAPGENIPIIKNKTELEEETE